jgi:hypothetical protein
MFLLRPSYITTQVAKVLKGTSSALMVNLWFKLSNGKANLYFAFQAVRRMFCEVEE